jgi:PAS domain S-box-containing protein
MVLQSSPSVIPLFVSIFVALGLAILSWRRRETPSALYFFILMLGVTIWAFGTALELLVVDLTTKILFAKVTYIGVVAVLAAWMAFVLQITEHERWLTRRTFILLLIDPILTLTLVWTNELHGLIWTEVTLTVSDGLIIGDYDHGIPFWIHAVYGYLILLSATVLLIRRAWTAESIYRRQAVVMLVSTFAPWIGNAVYLMGGSQVDLTPFGFVVTGFTAAWGLLRLRLLDIVPIAREIVIENMPDALVVVDTQGRILDLNYTAAAMMQVKPQATLGMSLAEHLPAAASVQKANPQTKMRQEITLHSNERTQYFELQISPLYDRLNRLRGHALLLHDVTERKQAAQRIETQNAELAKTNEALDLARRQAEEATQLKSQFLATMSHELRTPLTAIIGYTEIQLEGMAGELGEQQRDCLNRTLTNADHLLKLINEILDLAKIEAGHTEIIQKPFDLQSWMHQFIEQMNGLAEKKGLRFEHSIDPHLPDNLIGDPARLKQIAINLLSNAIKFTEKGTVKCEVRRDDLSTWSLVISDTGIGIPAHMHDVIFEEFRQVDGTSTRTYGGTGLGLAIVRKLVLLMNGGIRLNSQVGQGSTFTVTLPLVEIQPQPEFEEVIG